MTLYKYTCHQWLSFFFKENVDRKQANLSFLDMLHWLRRFLLMALQMLIQSISSWLCSSNANNFPIVALLLTLLTCSLTELQLPVSHGIGRPSCCALPAERQQGPEQEHVKLSLSGCHSQGWSPGWAHRGYYTQCVGRYDTHLHFHISDCV